MSLSKPVSFITPAQWFIDICNADIDDYSDRPTSPDYGSISFAIELSDDSDRVLSSINDIYFMINHYSDASSIIEELACGLIDDRWIELFIMNTTVMRESVKLFAFLNYAPVEVIEETYSLLATDNISVCTLCDIWLEKEWEVTDSVVRVIVHSPDAWKFIDRLVFDSSYATSKGVMRSIVRCKKSNPQVYRYAIKLLSKNESSLQYLLNLDDINGYGVQTTIDTITYYGMWKIVLKNAAARPIIDFVLHNPVVISKELTRGESARSWLIPQMEKNKILSDYIVAEDLSEYSFTDRIFSNAATVDIIVEWVVKEDSAETLLDGLILLAARVRTNSCKRIHHLLSEKKLANGEYLTSKITRAQWDSLMKNDINHSFVESELRKLNKFDVWDQFLFEYKLMPYWVESNPESDSWVLFNLNSYTVSNIREELCQDIMHHPHLMNYDNWGILFQTYKGVQIGIKCISYVIETGALFALLQSPFLETDELLQLIKQTDTLDYCDEDDFVAISRRPDAYETNLRLIRETNQELNLGILTAWHDPDRMFRMAELSGLNFREYLMSV